MIPRTGTIQTERLLFSRHDSQPDQPHSSPSIWCKWCRSPVKPITDDEAAILTRVCSRSIVRKFEAGLIHYIETVDGHHLVCPNSL